MSNVCPNCNTYVTTGKDFCCRTCRDSNGSSHGLRCSKIPKNCRGCQAKMVSKYDYCCKTCRDNRGASHGSSCTKVYSSSSSSLRPGLPSSSSSSSSSLRPGLPSSIKPTNCNNLRTGAPLYGPNTICFYKRTEPYYQFTNFYPSPITIGGITYSTTEHYFQSQKFTDPRIQSDIANAGTPRDAFNKAQAYAKTNPIRPNWHTGFKDTVMIEALRAKFMQHPSLGQLLRDTSRYNLVEHTVNDKEWGDNGDGTGNNKLGRYLEQVRAELISGYLRGGDYEKYKEKYLELKKLNL